MLRQVLGNLTPEIAFLIKSWSAHKSQACWQICKLANTHSVSVVITTGVIVPQAWWAALGSTPFQLSQSHGSLSWGLQSSAAERGLWGMATWSKRQDWELRISTVRPSHFQLQPSEDVFFGGRGLLQRWEGRKRLSPHLWALHMIRGYDGFFYVPSWLDQDAQIFSQTLF